MKKNNGTSFKKQAVKRKKTHFKEKSDHQKERPLTLCNNFWGKLPLLFVSWFVSWLFFRFGCCFRKPSSVSLMLLILPHQKPSRGRHHKRHLCQASLHFMRNHRVQSAQIHALTGFLKEGSAEIPM